MAAQVDVQGLLVYEPFAAAVLSTDKGPDVCMGIQVLSQIALDIASVLAGFMRAGKGFFTGMAAPVYPEQLGVGKALVAVFKRAAVGAVSCMAGHMLRQMAGVGKALAAGLDRAGARLAGPVECHMTCKVAALCKLPGTTVDGTGKAQPWRGKVQP